MNQQTVLVVDDNEDNRIIFATCLRSRGYEVKLAKNGAQALEMVAECRPSAVLMDIHMPVMNGLEATLLLKTRADMTTVPVLAVSAYEVHEPELRRAGFCTFLPKPVAPSFLVHAVRVCIEAAAGGGDEWIRVGPIEAAP